MIFTGQPIWFIFFCLLLAGAYAGGLYFRERKTEISAPARTVLGSLRFLAVFFISFLLLSPFVKIATRSKEKPLVVIAQDNSASVAMNADSSFYRKDYLDQLDGLATGLSQSCDVRLLTFGEVPVPLQPGASLEGTVGYTERLTNVSSLFADLATLYSHRNFGAVILSSDGIYNAGTNPLYLSSKAGFPVYAIALGDTARRKDLILSHLNFNRIVYLNDRFPLQATVQAHDCQGQRTLLTVTADGQRIHSQELPIDRTDFTATVNIILDASQAGLKRYQVSLSSLEGEVNTDNNRRDIFVEVLDARNRILILYHSPHPDVSALRNAAEQNLNYEVEDYAADEFTGQPEEYNMVILHQLPSADHSASALLTTIREKEVPALFILGTQSDLNRFNEGQGNLRIISPRNLYEETLPSVHAGFGLFTLDPATAGLLGSFPPLISPAGDYRAGTMTNVLLYQRIGTVQTSRPMLLLSQNQQYRSGVITGEGIWRWRMMNYSLAGNQDAFNELFNKVFQFLSLKEQRQSLRVYHKSGFPEFERLQMDAEVYNRNYELVNEPELEIVISDNQGRKYPFTFSRSGDAYRLDAGRLEAGNYSWQASVRVGEETFTSAGQFSVTRVELESLDLVADHSLLAGMAGQSGGKVYRPDQLDLLKNDILSNPDIKPVLYTRKRINELVNLPWLLAAVIVLLGTEWFIRKRLGSY